MNPIKLIDYLSKFNLIFYLWQCLFIYHLANVVLVMIEKFIILIALAFWTLLHCIILFKRQIWFLKFDLLQFLRMWLLSYHIIFNNLMTIWLEFIKLIKFCLIWIICQKFRLIVNVSLNSHIFLTCNHYRMKVFCDYIFWCC